ncbi:MAG: hypothetical protein NT023_21925 [Armatimonadetes bacterium]|nr:hypothetical protein [Armatimonadota bacterium]
MSNFPFTSLLCEEEILRFYPASLEEGIPLTAFELSTQEKEPGSAGGTSAWALSKTTPEQAFAIRGRSE